MIALKQESRADEIRHPLPVMASKAIHLFKGSDVTLTSQEKSPLSKARKQAALFEKSAQKLL